MSVPEITPAQLAEQLKQPPEQRPVLVDVRTSGEFAQVALAGARLMPLQSLGENPSEVAQLRGREVVVYCHHGVRSRAGAAFLISQGVAASSLAGGIDRYAVEVDPSLRRY